MTLLKWPRILPRPQISQSARGYGLGLLLIFVFSTAIIAASTSLLMAPIAGYTVQESMDESSAKQLAEEALDAAQRDILIQQRAGAVTTTAYRFPGSGTNTIAVPKYPGSLTTTNKGTYYVTITYARGFTLMLKANVTVGRSNVQVSRLVQLKGAPPPPPSGDLRFYSVNWTPSTQVARAGDVNNDGYDDLLITTGGQYLSGSTYLIMGRSLVDWYSLTDANGDFSFNNLSKANRTVSFIGRNIWSASGVGDVNNDGYDDIVLGNGGADRSRYDRGAGEAFLVLGRSTANWANLTDVGGNFNLGSFSDANMIYHFIGEYVQYTTGASVSAAGDVNNDGYDDFLIGAPTGSGYGYSGGSPGQFCGDAYLIRGRSTAAWRSMDLRSAGGNQTVRLVGESARVGFGSSVSAAGDVNNDGYDDILIGSPGSADMWTHVYVRGVGKTYYIMGRSTAEWNTYSGGMSMNHHARSGGGHKIMIITGADRGHGCGGMLSPAGDVNNDGFDDFLVSSGGNFYLILGRTSFNSSLYPDMTLADSIGYAKYTDVSDANLIFRFVSANSKTFSSAGDVNNDGYDDILVGEQLNDVGGADSGMAYIILGRSTAKWTSFTDAIGQINLANPLTDADLVVELVGSTVSERAGFSVSSAGDVDNNGYADILIDGSAPGVELTYLMWGRSTSGWAAMTDANARYNLSNI